MSFVTDSLELIESLQSQLHAAQQEKHSFARSQAEKFAEWITTTDFMHADDNEWFEDDTNEIFTTSDLYSQFLAHQKKQQEGSNEQSNLSHP